MKSIAAHISELDPDAQIMLLLGRYILSIHKVRKQVNGPHNAPFAQRLVLGWIFIGEVCIGEAHMPNVSSFKTHLLESGRPSLLTPCPSRIRLKERVSYRREQQDGSPHASNDNTGTKDSIDKIGHGVFQKTSDDNKTALSIEDTVFLDIMDDKVYKDDTNSWVAPLPFRAPRQPLPNNRNQAVNRLNSLRRTLEKKSEMKEQYIAFMKKIFDNDHAELAPKLNEGEECWYLPTFGVYHPQKPGQIIVVFDSSAQQNGISLYGKFIILVYISLLVNGKQSHYIV